MRYKRHRIRIGQRPPVEQEARRLLEADRRAQSRAKAQETVERIESKLSDSEVRDLLRPTPQELAQFHRIAAGIVGRHTASVFGALKVMLEYTLAKPEGERGSDPIQVQVNVLPAAPAKPAYELPVASSTATKDLDS